MHGMDTSKTSGNVLKTITCDRCKHEFVASLPIQPHSDPQTLHSNYVPSELEISQHKAILGEEEAILHEYEGEILRLQSILGKLKTERDMVEERVKKRRSAVSAVRRIPNEIWHEIFNSCVGHTEYSLFVDCTGVWARTLDISQVCSRWRTLIHAMPKLWSSFHVDVGYVKGDLFSAIELYLGRSGLQPLRVSLADAQDKCAELGHYSDRDEVEEAIGENALTAVEEIIKVIDSIEELHIGLNGEMVDYFVNWGVDDFQEGASMSCLRVLTIPDGRMFSIGGLDLFWTSIQHAPELTQIVAETRIEREVLEIPQITSVQLTGVDSGDDILHALRYATSLERLTASFDNHFRMLDPSSFTASSLLQLYLYDADAGDIASLFMGLKLPSLTTLQIHGSRSPWLFRPYSLKAILSTIEDSCSMKELVLDFPLHLSELLQVIKASPLLTRLQFGLPRRSTQQSDDEAMDFFTQLTIGIANTPVAPELTHLHITADDTLSWKVGVSEKLFQMLNSRTATSKGHRLTDVRLLFRHFRFDLLHGIDCTEQCRRGVDPAFSARAEILRSRGMACVVKFLG